MNTLFQNTYRRLGKLFGGTRLDSAGESQIENSATESPAADLHYAIERFSVFQGRVLFSGWAWCETSEIRTVALVTSTDVRFPITSYGLASEDVAGIHGDRGRNARFHETIDFTCEPHLVIEASLVFELNDNSVRTLKRFYESNLHADPALRLFGGFLSGLKPETKGNLLEIGARARSGVVRRQYTPEGWTYTGFDIVKGENVDVIGDAHKLSSYLPAENYDAVMGVAVLEHLIMPWKFVIEVNRVMKTGGLGFFLTVQCWPLHDQPWDFWRFSAEAWASLFNQHTGFEIIEAKVGQPAFVVANVGHPTANFPEGSMGYLASSVIFRKTSGTTLSWPVNVEDIVDTNYPTG